MGGLVYESINDLPPKLRTQVAVKILANAKAKPVADLDETKASKYHNVKVKVDDLTFDSRKEYYRYLDLMDALREGVIYDLCLQHNITLVEGYTKPDGERIRTQVYINKKKLMADRGYHIREV